MDALKDWKTLLGQQGQPTEDEMNFRKMQLRNCAKNKINKNELE